MSTREKILATLLVILFVCLVVWVVRTTPSTPPPQERVEPPTVMEYEGNTIIEEQDGKIIWELTCDKMRVDSITQNIELDGVKGKFFQYDEDKIWELTADRGIYFQNEKNIQVEGNIILKNNEAWQLKADKGIYYQNEKTIHIEGSVNVTNSEDGSELLSDQLDWFAGEEKLVATGNVKISKDDMRAFGDMAYSDNNFKHFLLLGNAKVLKGVKD